MTNKLSEGISQEEFELGMYGCIPPEDLEDQQIYTERRRLSPQDAAELGTYALDNLVMVVSRRHEPGGLTRVPVMTADRDVELALNEEGHIISDKDGRVGFETQGYLLGAVTLEDHDEQIENEKKLVPVRRSKPKPPLKAMELPLPESDY